MACLKLTVGCLAALGAVVVVLVLAVIGFFALGVHHMFDLPERAAASAIERTHAPLLAELRRRLADPSALRAWTPPPGLVAVRHLRLGDAGSGDPDLLTGTSRIWASHTLLNRGGVATIDRPGGPPQTCLLYELPHDGQTYWIYIADTGAVAEGPER
jgi:hypothetical protein